MLPAASDGCGSITYRFQCLAKKEKFTFTNKIGSDHQLQLPGDINVVSDVVWMGSSHGWLALYNRRNSDLFLSNPVADQHLKPPPLYTLGAADRVILSSDEREGEEEALAFMTFGPRRRIAFCSPRRSNEWTLLSGGEDGAYRNLAYSKKHNRLLCVCEDEDEVEGPSRSWGRSITLEARVGMLMEINPQSAIGPRRSYGFWWCATSTLKRGPRDPWKERYGCPSTGGVTTLGLPTKIDSERGELVEMKDNWLGGLAMFVGINHSFALPAAGLGLRPDSIYFTDENQVGADKLWGP
ncbi:hypothetical protein OROMI_010000 [Orobanche minor]